MCRNLQCDRLFWTINANWLMAAMLDRIKKLWINNRYCVTVMQGFIGFCLKTAEKQLITHCHVSTLTYFFYHLLANLWAVAIMKRPSVVCMSVIRQQLEATSLYLISCFSAVFKQKSMKPGTTVKQHLLCMYVKQFLDSIQYSCHKLICINHSKHSVY